VTAELNPRFDFNSFKVRVGNELAVTASRAVAERPGSVYNPLYIHGGEGLGKTHLLTAIARGSQEVAESTRIEYLTPDRLAEAFQATAAAGQGDAFHNRLADVDILLIDEFGYLNLKPEQSNIFFKLMEERYHRHSTIITTNLEYDEWHNFLGNRPMVEALWSRLRHYCHTVRIKGPSLRDPQG